MLLSATLLALIAFIYWSTSNLIDHQASETVEAEIQGLAEQYQEEGLSRLIDVIGERSGRDGDLESVYLLIACIRSSFGRHLWSVSGSSSLW